jgi:hypothetical protein
LFYKIHKLKHLIMKNSLLCSLILVVILASCNKSPKAPPYLFTKTEKTGTSNAAKDIAFLKGINATANLQLLSDTTKRFRIPMPDGKDIIIEERRVDRGKNSISWYGEVAGTKQSFVFLTYTPKAIIGSITIGKDIYRIINTGKGIYQIAQLDPNKMTESDDDGIVPKYEKKDNNEADGCPDPSTDIDVMVVYTQAAEDGAGGAEGMEVFIYQCLALTNLCYENSDIALRMNLVHFEKVTYTEAGDAFVDRAALRDPADGELDNVHAMRDTYGADIVAMLVETSAGTNCGYAYIMDPVSNAHESWAFSVIKRSCAIDNKSFPHELGHIMSARHHDDATATPYAYVHGYQVLAPADPATPAWRTIMSKIGGTVRIPFFSNPDVQYPLGGASTDAMGTAATEDNHRVLNNTAATVANFRCSSPAINNVWMKDTWNDTGLEPDPATVGESMSRTPYIWVRNSQDAGFLNAHQHEDPEFGEDNWIYVKMHNGSASSQTGNLELYIADASVSLSWPGGWTLITSIPLTLNASSTRIVEQLWNTVPFPASGTHYCIIARWISATDPMHTAEGSSISNNVRENNNIVWKNLNIVDLSSDADSKVVLNISGYHGKKFFQLLFEDVTNFPKPRFTATGKVTITIDDKLASFWKEAKNKSTGLKASGNNTFELTGSRGSLDNIPIPEGYTGKITIVFKKAATTPRLKYEFSVKQYSMDDNRPNLIGAVDYELINK